VESAEQPSKSHDLGERTFAFARRVVRLFRALPHGEPFYTIGRQLLRSGTSIGANQREAFRGRSRAEFVAKLGDSLREAEESLYWLDLLVAEELVPATKLDPLREECREIIAMLVASLNSAKRRKSER